jgi:hypothetical protein
MGSGYKALAGRVRKMRGAPLVEIVGLFEPWIGGAFSGGEGTSRQRLFSSAQVFWLFLSQVLGSDKSCRETVRKWLGWLAVHRGQIASPNTAAYCKARKRLPEEELVKIDDGLVAKLEAVEAEEDRWLGRRVKVVDGSSFSMPDTEENQGFYPQPRGQKPGCGFPVMRVVALFSLATGTLLALAKDPLAVHERTLFRRLWKRLEPGEVVLGDRGFNSFADLYWLGVAGVDSVMRKHQRRGAGSKRRRRLGKNDWLVDWFKTGPCPHWLSPEEWRSMPETLVVREIICAVDIPGFRSESFVVVTTLLDPIAFPKRAFAQLYRRRWRAELHLRDMKIALGMDILRCKSPDMVHKELRMFAIAYNLIRAFMLDSARAHTACLDRISFKGTLSTLRQWAPLFLDRGTHNEAHSEILRLLLFYVARDSLPDRPNRVEPRARKRRPKNYALLTRPRSIFNDCPHRNRYRRTLS